MRAIDVLLHITSNNTLNRSLSSSIASNISKSSFTKDTLARLPNSQSKACFPIQNISYNTPSVNTNLLLDFKTNYTMHAPIPSITNSVFQNPYQSGHNTIRNNYTIPMTQSNIRPFTINQKTPDQFNQESNDISNLKRQVEDLKKMIFQMKIDGKYPNRGHQEPSNFGSQIKNIKCEYLFFITSLI